MIVNWTAAALSDLRAIEVYIARHSRQYGVSMVERIFDRTAQLADFPMLGAQVPEYEDASLRELLETQPLQQGLAELVGYLQLGCDVFKTVVDEGSQELIHWEATASHGEKLLRSARLPQVIFVR